MKPFNSNCHQPSSMQCLYQTKIRSAPFLRLGAIPNDWSSRSRAINCWGELRLAQQEQSISHVAELMDNCSGGERIVWNGWRSSSPVKNRKIRIISAGVRRRACFIWALFWTSGRHYAWPVVRSSGDLLSIFLSLFMSIKQCNVEIPWPKRPKWKFVNQITLLCNCGLLFVSLHCLRYISHGLKFYKSLK
jgi:hypothetical protein